MQIANKQTVVLTANILYNVQIATNFGFKLLNSMCGIVGQMTTPKHNANNDNFDVNVNEPTLKKMQT
jgi:hypothetical protein